MPSRRPAQPADAAGGFDLLRVRVAPGGLAARRAELKRAIVGGQYDFPLGLFFGGHGPSPARRLLEEQLPRWVGSAEVVIHLDVHTGLGRWGRLALLLEARRGARAGPMDGRGRSARGSSSAPAWGSRTRAGAAWDRGARPGSPTGPITSSAPSSGPTRASKVLAALRAENRAHHWGRPDDPATLRAKRRLLEAFTPADPDWRASALAQGLAAVRRAFEAASRPSVVA